ncbi:MAG: helix-turn-helix transcriptional regulator [Dehalococcoidia bacterium]|nr:helix-turn-helix transcriptional regulator [Dehalococcoidia bacterium]
MLKDTACHIEQDDTTTDGWLDEYIKKYERDPDYVAEGLAIQIIEDVIRSMQRKGISRSDLASIMGVARAYITRMFNAPPNLTLRSIAQLALALGLNPEVRLSEPAPAITASPVWSTLENEFRFPDATYTTIPAGVWVTEDVLPVEDLYEWVTPAQTWQAPSQNRGPKDQEERLAVAA